MATRGGMSTPSGTQGGMSVAPSSGGGQSVVVRGPGGTTGGQSRFVGGGGGSSRTRRTRRTRRSKEQRQKERAKKNIKKVEQELGMTLTPEARSAIRSKAKTQSVSPGQARQLIQEELGGQTTRADLQQRGIQQLQQQRSQTLSPQARQRAFEGQQTTRADLQQRGLQDLQGTQSVGGQSRMGGYRQVTSQGDVVGSAPVYRRRTNYTLPDNILSQDRGATGPTTRTIEQPTQAPRSYLRRVETGSFIAPDEREIPVTQVQRVVPTLQGQEFTRPATQQEFQSFRRQTGQVPTVTEAPELTEGQEFDRALDRGEFGESLSAAGTNIRGAGRDVSNVLGTVSDVAGQTVESSISSSGSLANQLGVRTPVQQAIGDTRAYQAQRQARQLGGDIAGEFTRGFIPSTTGGAALTAATFGGGAILGGAARGAGAATRALTTRIPRAGLAAQQTFRGVSKVGAAALTGADVLRVGGRISEAESARDVPRILGEEARLAGSVGLGFATGGRAVSRGIGRRRTRGSQELPQETVVDPKYFEGQKYPEITPGTTAEQLRSEFYDPVLPGETPNVPRGFAARSEGVVEGSDLVGWQRPGEPVAGYAAPKAVPTYLRIGGQQPRGFRLFGAAEPDPMPTLARVTFKDINVAQGQPTQTPRALSQARADEITRQLRERPGEAILPFMSGEREAVFRGGLTNLRRRYYTNIEGRRVPIVEADVGPTTNPSSQADETLSSILGSPSASRAAFRREPIFTPERPVAPGLARRQPTSDVLRTSRPTRRQTRRAGQTERMINIRRQPTRTGTSPLTTRTTRRTSRITDLGTGRRTGRTTRRPPARPPARPPTTPRPDRSGISRLPSPSQRRNIPFEVNVKQNDKFRTTSFTPTFQQAVRRLRTRLENTPAKRGFISRAGNPIPANLGRGFRQSRRRPAVNIELRDRFPANARGSNRLNLMGKSKGSLI